jgi:hypothetical protein
MTTGKCAFGLPEWWGRLEAIESADIMRAGVSALVLGTKMRFTLVPPLCSRYRAIPGHRGLSIHLSVDVEAALHARGARRSTAALHGGLPSPKHRHLSHPHLHQPFDGERQVKSTLEHAVFP